MFFGKGLIASQLKIKVQVKGLTHMFCFWIFLGRYIKNMSSIDLSHWNAYANLGWMKNCLTLNGHGKVNAMFF